MRMSQPSRPLSFDRARRNLWVLITSIVRTEMLSWQMRH